MKTLHVYLTRQVLATLLMTVAVFTFVLLIGNMLKEIMGLLVNRQATLGGVFEAVGLLIPFVLVFALPMGMLTAALLVFGRFSADQELTAVRSSGISLIALISPILLLSVLLCGLSAWINMEIAPRSRIAFKHLIDDMRSKVSNSALPEGRYVKDFAPWSFYIGANDGRTLHDVYVFRVDSNQVTDLSIRAEHGKVETTNQQMIITLFDAHKMQRWGDTLVPGDEGTMTLVVPLSQSAGATEKIPLSDMTFGQLRQELRELDRNFNVPNRAGVSVADLKRQKKVLEELKVDASIPVLVQIHRQVASSFACFGFTLIGIPLGIRAHRRETNIGIAMALGLVLIYYSFVILGQSLQTHAQFVPHLIIWVPNFIFEVVGVVMLWRANRGI